MTSYNQRMNTISFLTIISIILQPIHSQNIYFPSSSFSSSSFSSSNSSTIRFTISFVLSLLSSSAYVHGAFHNVHMIRKASSSFLPSSIMKQHNHNTLMTHHHHHHHPQQHSSLLLLQRRRRALSRKRNFHLYSSLTTSQNNQDNNNLSSPSPQLPYDEYSTNPIPNSIPSPSQQSHLKLSNLEKEFYTMMSEFSLYTPHDISTIPNPSYRALYSGVLAGSNEPQVMNAFAIIFNDLLPIRIAGRMIYKHLKNVMDENIDRRREEDVVVMNETGLSMDAIEYGRKTFMCALNSVQDSYYDDDDDSDGDDKDKKKERKKAKKMKEEGMLSMTELIDTGIVDMVVELMQYESFDAFVNRMEEEESEKINFEKFMIGLQKCALMKNESSTSSTSGTNASSSENDDNSIAPDVFCDISCDLEEVLLVTSQRMAPMDARKKEMTISQRKQKYSDRYDEMVKTFEEWETIIGPSSSSSDDNDDINNNSNRKTGRMGQVLAGCFAGAKNERIVYALKIVYMDYSALRVGGDLVFKLMNKVVQRKK